MFLRTRSGSGLPASANTRIGPGLVACAALLLLAGVACAQEPKLRTVAQILAEAPTLGDRPVRVRATVTGAGGVESYFIQDSTGGLFVLHRAPVPRPRVGDLVELTATLVPDGPKPRLAETEIRLLGSGKLPAPRPLTIEDALAGTWEGCVVRMVGRVAVGTDGQPRAHAVLLIEEGTGFSAQYEDHDDGVTWPQLDPGQLVEMTGVLSLRGRTEASEVPFSVILRSRRDIRVIGPQPWWMPPRLYRVLGGAGAVVLMVAAWALIRRRKVRKQMREIQASCELEVAAERKYRDFVENATDIVLTHDLDGKITSFNRAGQRLLGWTSEEIIGRNISELLAPEERGTAGGITASGDSLPDRDRSEVFRLDLLAKDGRVVPFEISSWMEMRDGKAQGLQAICRDVSERRRSEEERGRFQRKLQEAQKVESLGILAGGVAHDFNNLLTGILGNASLAVSSAAPGSTTARCLQQIEEAAERAADLCRQMLAYSGHGRFMVERLDVNVLLQAATDLLRASVPANVTLDLQLGEALPCIIADATQIRQVVMNLVINASEAIGENPGTISIITGQTNVESSHFADAHVFSNVPGGDYLFLEIRDTGCGMNPETQARIFDPFFTTKFTGRGLGLAAVLGIVRGHRGALKVQSEPGKGATFRLFLPSAGPMPRQVEFAFPTMPARSTAGLVLVVDDDETVRRVTQNLLESMGYDVILAADGAEGLEEFRASRERITAVLIDLTMPRLDGAELFREMQRLQPNVRVLLMSGFAERQALARFAGRGLAGFIQKPFNSDALRTKLRAILQEVPVPPSNVIPMRA